MEYKQVIVVRQDLKMSKGKTAAQACHGSVICAMKAMKKKHNIFKAWSDEGQKKAIVKVKDLRALKSLALKAKKMKMIYEIVRDKGHTELKPGTVTVLTIGPDTEERLNQITGKLKLI
jgi:PTH2 family peptidyl-tRNA hydrolase